MRLAMNLKDLRLKKRTLQMISYISYNVLVGKLGKLFDSNIS
jgi:hypothetical protein